MIIGLTGYAQSGKDTLAGMLIGLHKYERIAFADKIRKILYEANPLISCGHTGYLKDLVDRVGWEEAKKETPVRRLLQDFGVGARKTFGEDFWIEQALKGVNPEDKFVITDVRFPNEADAIKDLGGQIWRVKRIGVESVNTHVSESAMDSYQVDQIFINNGSMEDLIALLRVRMNQFL
jgi:hypothetical protein